VTSTLNRTSGDPAPYHSRKFASTSPWRAGKRALPSSASADCAMRPGWRRRGRCGCPTCFGPSLRGNRTVLRYGGFADNSIGTPQERTATLCLQGRCCWRWPSALPQISLRQPSRGWYAIGKVPAATHADRPLQAVFFVGRSPRPAIFT
jgi:hypothetical protein